VILVSGFILLLALSLLTRDADLTKQLASVFSGWIVAIVGFYFMRNQTYQVAAIAENTGLKNGTRMAIEMEKIYDELQTKHEAALSDLHLLKEKYKELREAYIETTKE
jgi:cyanate permease